MQNTESASYRDREIENERKERVPGTDRESARNRQGECQGQAGGVPGKGRGVGQ